MARNVIESDFRSSKMATGGHFVKKFKKRRAAYWSQMARNVIKIDFRSSKMAASGHFVKISKKSKSCVLIWNDEKCDQKWFSVIQNGCRRPFCEKISKKLKVSHWSKMATNAIKSDFLSSKMAASRYFAKKTKVAHWSEMARNAIKSDFRSSKMAAGGHFVKNLNKF